MTSGWVFDIRRLDMARLLTVLSFAALAAARASPQAKAAAGVDGGARERHTFASRVQDTFLRCRLMQLAWAILVHLDSVDGLTTSWKQRHWARWRPS